MCAEKNPKFHNICKNCQIGMHAKIFLKIRRKPTSPAMRNNKFNSRSLINERPLSKEAPGALGMLWYPKLS